jgi:hypothetical protein
MKTEIDGKTFIIFNRDTVHGDFHHRGKGPWHWGLEDPDGNLRVSKLGLETEQNAMNMMDAYTWAIMHDRRLIEQLDSELTFLPEGTVVNAKLRVLFQCAPAPNESHRQSSSYTSAKRAFVESTSKNLGLSK